MNKYQEALDRIGRSYYLSQESGDFEHFENLYLENKKTLQELVDRSTPMKPIGKHTSFKCGRCGTRIRSGKGSSSFTKDTVCRNCYQVIDWSKDE